MVIRIAGKIAESIVDGPGLRYVVFAQGCERHCFGCQNAGAMTSDGGELAEVSDIMKEIMSNPLLDGVTLSGGEPFLQAEAMSQLAKAVKEAGLSVWTYTGYTWEELMEELDSLSGAAELLENTRVLVDGPYDENQRAYDLDFRGSRNQRLLDAPESLRQGKPVSISELN